MNLKKQKIPILLHHADNNLFCNQDKIVQKTVSIAKMSGIWKKKITGLYILNISAK